MYINVDLINNAALINIKTSILIEIRDLSQLVTIYI